jgi:hypothetical protein
VRLVLVPERVRHTQVQLERVRCTPVQLERVRHTQVQLERVRCTPVQLERVRHTQVQLVLVPERVQHTQVQFELGLVLGMPMLVRIVELRAAEPSACEVPS